MAQEILPQLHAKRVRQEGVSRKSVRRWLTRAENDDRTRTGLTTEESVEIKCLKAENRRLRLDNETLRRASVCFVRVLDRETTDP